VSLPREGGAMMRIGFLASHPIQYHAPLLRALAQQCDLQVYFAHRQDAQAQANDGYGVAFDWDVDLLSGYDHRFLRNDAKRPSVSRFFGCRSAEIGTLIRAGQFDGFVVSGWNLWVYWQAIWACRRCGVKVLARGDSHLGTPRSWVRRTIKRLIYPTLFAALDGFLAVGTRSEAYLRHYRVPANKIHAAQHVIDTARFARGAELSDDQRAKLRAQLNIPAKRPVVLFVGRLIVWKRVDEVIRAISLKAWNNRPVLLVVGDGPERARLMALADELEVDSVFAGFVNQAGLPQHYALADLLVLPSHETWGLVVNEAIASGTPVLVSDAVGCMDELVISGQTGGSFELGNLHAMADEMQRILELGRAAHAPGLRAKVDWFSPERAASGIVAAVAGLLRTRET
jgi:glycosyltransferase involved in cell wall biosynthesis